MAAPAKFIGPRDLKLLLAPLGITYTQFARMASLGHAPKPQFYMGARMPRWARSVVVAFLEGLEAQTQTGVTA